MNESELAAKMLKWEEIKRSLDEIEQEIKGAVLELQKTQTVGNVRASYSKGRVSRDYESAIKAAELVSDALDPFKIVRETTDYRSACKEFGITEIPSSQAPPSVSVKLLSKEEVT